MRCTECGAPSTGAQCSYCGTLPKRPLQVDRARADALTVELGILSPVEAGVHRVLLIDADER